MFVVVLVVVAVAAVVVAVVHAVEAANRDYGQSLDRYHCRCS